MNSLGLLLASLMVVSPAMAQDMESLLEGKATNQQSVNRSYLANAVHSLLGIPTAEQANFLRQLEAAQWSEALVTWDAAFKNSSFASTENAKALRALLQLKAGLPITALEGLTSIGDPRKINFQILTSWREAVNDQNPAWTVARITWIPAWSDFFGPMTEVRALTSQLRNQKDMTELTNLAMRAPVGSRERALIDWHLALEYAQKDNATKAAQMMGSLLKAPNNPISADVMNMTAARMLFQNGYFEAAQRYYEKVPKSSEDYLEAQEERAWTYLRRHEPQNSLAVTQSLVNPTLAGQVGPETWFVRALSQLKVCDYAGAILTLQAFPREFNDRSVAMEAMIQSGQATPEVLRALETMKTRNLSRAELAQISKKVPRNLSRDERLQSLIKTQVILQSEADAAEGLVTMSQKTLSTPPAELIALRDRTRERSQAAQTAVIQRSLQLAKDELAETKRILNKMRIVEAEVIQRVDATPRLVKNLKPEIEIKKGNTGSSARDTLKFPLEKEFWLDELTNYRVDIKKGCLARFVK